MIGKFIKKPVEIEAVQWNGDNELEIMDFVGKKLSISKPPAKMHHVVDGIPATAYSIIIPTLEGDMTASKGDYIIRGVKGEFYPCKPDIFEATYDAVTIDPDQNLYRITNFENQIFFINAPTIPSAIEVYGRKDVKTVYWLAMSESAYLVNQKRDLNCLQGYYPKTSPGAIIY